MTLPGTCFDFSVDGMLAAQNAHVKRVPIIYHLWALHKAGVVTWSKWWDEFLEVAQMNDALAVSNIEADQSPVPEWRMPHTTLPELKGGTLAQVKETHRLIQVPMARIFAAAAISKAKVWDYRTVQVHSLELWVSQPERAYAELERLVKLVSYKQGSLAKRLHASGGGVLYDCYLPDAWNVTNAWVSSKAIVAMERQRAAYKQLGIRAMPLLNPHTVGGAANVPVRPDLLNALLQAARSGGDYGWWAMPDSVTPALAKEVGAWIK